MSQEQMEWPEHTSIELQDLIKKLLCPDLSKRLGVRDAKTNFAQNACAGIKKHSFFAGTSWEATKIGSFAVSSVLNIDDGCKSGGAD